MNSILIVILCIILAVIIGFLFGLLLVNINLLIRHKKEMKGLKAVLDGEKENFIEVDGVKYKAEKFVVRNENGTETLIDLKGGKISQYGKKNSKEERRENLTENNSIIREDSRRAREKERDIRARDRRRARRRRF